MWKSHRKIAADLPRRRRSKNPFDGCQPPGAHASGDHEHDGGHRRHDAQRQHGDESTNATAGAVLSSTPIGPASAQIYLPSGTPPVSPVALGGVSTTLGGAGTVTVNANTGGGQPLAAPVQTQAQASVMQPYLGLNYIIALQGIFPSRN
jgi:hypothetical protein